MLAIGLVDEALEKMVKRLSSRTTFGKTIIELRSRRSALPRPPHRHRDDPASVPQGGRHDGQGRQQDHATRYRQSQGGGTEHGAEDHRQRNPGGGGVCDDAGLAKACAGIRTLRLADGPPEVHNRGIVRLELRKYANSNTH